MTTCLGLPGRRCGALIKIGPRCDPCRRAMYRIRDAQRDPWVRNFYRSSAWRRLADAVVAAADRCAWCGTPKGIVQLTGGHIIGIAQDRSLALEPSNCAASCRACQERAKREPDPRKWPGGTGHHGFVR